MVEREEKIKILIAEDEAPLRMLMSTALEEEQYDIFEAEDGEEALEQARERLPHLLILDINLPKRDGLSCVNLLRSDLETSLIPILILTARGSLKNKLDAFELGADAYLTKPFYNEELLGRVKNLLKRSYQLMETHPYSGLLGERVFFRAVKKAPNDLVVGIFSLEGTALCEAQYGWGGIEERFLKWAREVGKLLPKEKKELLAQLSMRRFGFLGSKRTGEEMVQNLQKRILAYAPLTLNTQLIGVKELTPERWWNLLN